MRLIDADALRLMKVEECAGHTIEYAMGWKACLEYINAATTIDAAPVIRCRNCARAELRGVQIDGEPDEAELYCTEWADQVGAWEYCSRGRRKGESDE